MTNTTINKIILSAATAMFLTACGSSGGDTPAPTAAEAASTKIQAYAVDDNAAQPVLADYQALGLSNVNAENLEEYNALIKAADSATEVDELSELNKIVALGNIQAYADDNSNPAPTVADYAGAGVTGVTEDNLAAVNALVDAKTADEVAALAVLNAIVVTASNHAPVATAQAITVDEDTNNNAITLAGTDADSDTLTYTIATAPAHGTATLTGTVVNYTPTADYFGADSFTFTVNDGTVDSAEATVSITVTDVAEPIVDIEAPVITLLGDNTVDILINTPYTDAGATALDDIDGDITASIVTTSDVNTSSAGDYTVAYSVSDDANNTATEVTRTVTVHATQFVAGTDMVKDLVTGLVWDKTSTDYNGTNPCTLSKTMPTVEQLQSVMVYDNNESAIVDGFDVDKVDGIYYATSDGWKAEFKFGKVVQPLYKGYNEATKTICVDATNEVVPTLESLERNATNDTVTDPNTGLVWDDKAVTEATYANAVEACDNDDKRLPTLVELDSIYDRENHTTVDTFEILHNGFTWTSTELAANADYGVDKTWLIHLDRENNATENEYDGAIDASSKSTEAFYTCVEDAN